MNIPNNLKFYRKLIGLSQAKLAKIAGLNETHYQKIEYGLIEPSVKIALRLAQALETTVEVLFPLPDRNGTYENSNT